MLCSFRRVDRLDRSKTKSRGLTLKVNDIILLSIIDGGFVVLDQLILELWSNVQDRELVSLVGLLSILIGERNECQ